MRGYFVPQLSEKYVKIWRSNGFLSLHWFGFCLRQVDACFFMSQLGTVNKQWLNKIAKLKVSELLVYMCLLLLFHFWKKNEREKKQKHTQKTRTFLFGVKSLWKIGFVCNSLVRLLCRRLSTTIISNVLNVCPRIVCAVRTKVQIMSTTRHKFHHFHNDCSFVAWKKRLHHTFKSSVKMTPKNSTFPCLWFDNNIVWERV